MKNYKKIKKCYNWGNRLLSNSFQINGQELSKNEILKSPSRTEVINFLLDLFKNEKSYLEIGVRRLEDNFNKINASHKLCVDPGFENPDNQADYKMTSDDFFKKVNNEEILSKDIRFDVIFIDGLHLAEQVERDIKNALNFIKEDGFIVLHDCNPPTEWHAREEFYYDLTPARNYWNGTTWKAFYKYRNNDRLTSVCVDTDWGVGVLTKRNTFNRLTKNANPFYEFKLLEKTREEALNLVSFGEFKRLLTEE